MNVPKDMAGQFPEIEALVERLYAGATQNERALAETLGRCWMGHTHAIMRLLAAREVIKLEKGD